MDQIVIVVDRSGSMSKIKDDAEGGLNEFINSQKEVGEAVLTLAQFDDKYDLVHDNIDVKTFESYKLEPRGMTALLDAIGKTASTASSFKASGKKIFMIVTDGQENDSREWKKNQVLDIITKMKKDDWEFLFIGADEASLEQAVAYGMERDTAILYDKSGKGSKDSYGVMDKYSTAIRGGMSKSDAVRSLNADVASAGTLSKS